MFYLVELYYLLYIAISVAMTIWVARTLHRNGRVFLVDRMHGNEKLADSINHLLVVGFYLLNIGFICTVLRFGERPANGVELIEFLSTKVGVVLLVLGAIHFINLRVLSRSRQHFGPRPVAPPPYIPNGA